MKIDIPISCFFRDIDFCQAIKRVRELGFTIVDVDSVIVAQAPKLTPYRDEMRANLAGALGIDVDNVGVKATTTEELGFEGREEGISARAVALLAKREG